MVEFLLFVMILLLGSWLWIRRKRRIENSMWEEDTPEPGGNPAYHGVSIRFSPKACNAVKARAGERFLASDPPPLPLPGCDAQRCDCHFVHHEDRRRDSDRRSPFNPNTGMSGTGHYEVERRQGKDRRQSGNSN